MLSAGILGTPCTLDAGSTDFAIWDAGVTVSLLAAAAASISDDVTTLRFVGVLCVEPCAALDDDAGTDFVADFPDSFFPEPTIVSTS